MAQSRYFALDHLDSPATDDDLGHLESELGVRLPNELRTLWTSTATFNGELLLADGTPGPYFRLFHPSTALERSRASALAKVAPGAIVFGASEDWDYAVILEATPRYVDVDRESGEVLSELGDSFDEFVQSLRAEFAEQDDLLN